MKYVAGDVGIAICSVAWGMSLYYRYWDLVLLNGVIITLGLLTRPKYKG